MTTPEGYNVRVLQGLSAHFKQPAGPSRAGTDWAVLLSNSRGEKQILVRTYADENGSLSQEEQAELALQFVGQLIQSGWQPEQYRGEPGELVASHTASQALPRAEHKPKKPWWQLW
jgi:hypothetical protein